MKKFLHFLLAITILGCSSDDGSNEPIVGGPTGGGGGNTPTYLKDLVNYPIGNIVSASKLASTSTSNLTFKEVLLSEFNSITAENDMKSNNMFLGPGNYDWSDGDAIVAYAKANNLRVHGHALAWHQQQPSWFNSFAGTDEEFEMAVLDYITAAVTHFAQETFSDGTPVVASWDVVNEAFADNASGNVLYTKIDDFVAKAFFAARAGDPDVKLFYNDYGIAGSSAKRGNIIAMVNDFQSRNPAVPIDGIGMQMHINHDWPTTDLPIAIQDIANTGLLVHLSELDIRANYNDDLAVLTEARAQLQANQYQRVSYYYNTYVPISQRHGITIWGMRDQESWLYDGNTEWPLLFDTNFDPKVAYDGFAEGLKGNAP